MSDVTHIRVAIFEATQMSCDLMSRVLADPAHHIEVVRTGISSELGDDLLLQDANVALISPTLREGNLSGFTLLHRLSKSHRDLNCVLLLDRDNRDLVIEAFRSGAVGVCQRDQPYEQLLKCIRCVSRGQVWASSQQMRYVLEALAGGLPVLMSDMQGQNLLSKREEEIVSKVAEGLKNREIGELLYVSEHTVKNHLFRIFSRLGISSRAELILYAHGHKLSADSRTGTDSYRKR